jgi:hypothetical protein
MAGQVSQQDGVRIAEENGFCIDYDRVRVEADPAGDALKRRSGTGEGRAFHQTAPRQEFSLTLIVLRRLPEWSGDTSYGR